MKVQVEEVSPIERRLDITVEAAVVSKELDSAYQALSRQVKVPGFRSGKVPRRILEQRYKADVENDVLQRVVSKAYVEAVKEHKVDVVADPHISNAALKLNEPLNFTARVEVKPIIVAKDYKGVAFKPVDVAVTDATVDEQLEKIRSNMTSLEPITRDVAAKGDFAIIDFTAQMDGKDFPGNKGTAVTVEVAPGELVDANLPQLEGVKVGAVKEFDYTFPAEYRVEEVKGKTAHFVATLKELKEKKAPPLDDAFAEKSGAGVHTLKELKDKIRADLERAERRKAETDEREALIKALLEKNTFEVPKAMIERGVDLMLEGAINMFARQGLDPNTLNFDWAKLRDDLRPKADLEVRGQLLFESVAKQEKIEANDDELEKKLEAMAEESGQALSQLRKHYKSAEQKAGLKSRIQEEKTVAFLKGAAAKP